MVSMIVPIYCGEKYLERLIQMYDVNRRNLKSKFKNQDLEMILVNDYPGEKIDVSRKDITIVINMTNIGIHASRLKGLQSSKGEYILFLDQDDIIDDEYIAKQLKIAVSENSDATVCNGFHCKLPIYDTEEQGKMSVMQVVGTNKIISPGQVLLKRDSIPHEWMENIIKISGADDWFLWILMHEKNAKFSYNNEKLYKHVINGRNRSLDSEAMIASVDEVRHKLNDLLCDSDYKKNVLKCVDSTINIHNQKRYINKILSDNKKSTEILRKRMLEYNCKNIVIYGFGLMGRMLFKTLQEVNVPIELILDEKGSTPDMPDIKLPEENVIKNISEKQLVIVTPLRYMNEIKDRLRNMGVKNIITIEELMCECQIKGENK